MPRPARILSLILTAFPAAFAYELDKWLPYTVVFDSTGFYADSLLSPPAVDRLERGTIVNLVRVLPEASLVALGNNYYNTYPTGWVRNRDLHWADMPPRFVRMGPHWITHWDVMREYVLRNRAMVPMEYFYEFRPGRDFEPELEGRIPFAPVVDSQ
jgi:hypothetical protein